MVQSSGVWTGSEQTAIPARGPIPVGHAGIGDLNPDKDSLAIQEIHRNPADHDESEREE
jgi:hypothetical protein